MNTKSIDLWKSFTAVIKYDVWFQDFFIVILVGLFYCNNSVVGVDALLSGCNGKHNFDDM